MRARVGWDRWARLWLAVVVLVLGRVAVALAAPGDPVSSFGSAGHVVLPVSQGSNSSTATAAVVQPDGKLVVAGYAYQDGPMSDAAVVVARLNVDGSVDTSFGQGGSGVTTTSIDSGGTSGDDQAWSVALGPGGTIVVGGNTQSSAMVARYTSTGVLDTAFNPSGALPGVVTFSFPGHIGPDHIYGVAVQPADGKIVAGGYASGPGAFAVARLNTDGSLDTTFGPSHTGLVETSIDTTGSFKNDVARALVLQPADGKIVLAGTEDLGATNSAFALARYNPDGTLDSGFGSGGIARTSEVAGKSVTGSAVALDSSGRLVIAGDDNDGSVSHFALQRFKPDGTPDPTFNGGNLLVTPIGYFDLASGVAVQPDGKIVAGGSAFTSAAAGSERFAVARYSDDGSFDTTLGGTGYRTYASIGGNNDAASGLVLATGPASASADRRFRPRDSGAGEVLYGFFVGNTANAGATQDQAAVQKVSLTAQAPPHLTAVKYAEVANKEEAAAAEGQFGYRSRWFRGRRFVFDPHGDATEVADDGSIQYVTAVRNDSGQPVDGITIGDRLPCSPYFSRAVVNSAEGVFVDRVALTSVEGSVGTDATRLEAGQILYLIVRCTVAPSADSYSNTATVFQDSALLGTVSAQRIKVVHPKPAQVGEADANGASGTTPEQEPPVHRVEIAVREVPDNATFAAAGGARHKPVCRWLSSNGRFVTKPAIRGRCANVVWLRATGTKRWRARFAHRLPRGRYLVFARSLDAAGTAEEAFGFRAGNERRLVVR